VTGPADVVDPVRFKSWWNIGQSSEDCCAAFTGVKVENIERNKTLKMAIASIFFKHAPPLEQIITALLEVIYNIISNILLK
jgi:hypothetical protein